MVSVLSSLFPSGPHPKVMEDGCRPTGTFFFSRRYPRLKKSLLLLLLLLLLAAAAYGEPPSLDMPP